MMPEDAVHLNPSMSYAEFPNRTARVAVSAKEEARLGDVRSSDIMVSTTH